MGNLLNVSRSLVRQASHWQSCRRMTREQPSGLRSWQHLRTPFVISCATLTQAKTLAEEFRRATQESGQRTLPSCGDSEDSRRMDS